jgi:hypothetical protein
MGAQVQCRRHNRQFRYRHRLGLFRANSYSLILPTIVSLSGFIVSE